MLDDLINPFDWDKIGSEFRSAKPFPYFAVDNFLKADFADKVLESFPSFEQAKTMGRTFSAVNEVGKIQITDSSKFPQPIAQLNELLARQEFLDLMAKVTGIPKLLADTALNGGGIHETGPRGRLDVHVDFNLLPDRPWHRRLNILIYFNKDWKQEYGGEIELWDPEVKVRHQAYLPAFNRCVVFETNEISYHGVSAVNCPPGTSRKSFAGYYYTIEAPAHYPGKRHTTIFKARPDEKFKGNVLMPAEKAFGLVGKVVRKIKKGTKK